MKLITLAFRRETAMPMVALSFASGVCVAMVMARIVWTGNVRYAFLIWNLFLAWIPLLLALLATEKYHTAGGLNVGFLCLANAWLLFFPNAPYIFTDVIHLTRGFRPHFWVDLSLILSCALTGFVLGFLSLYLMHSLVRGILGSRLSWLFIAVVAGLSGFGICLGRFLRFNSWDVLVRPFELFQGIERWVTEPSGTRAFGVLFAAFLFIAYVMLYGLTHLEHAKADRIETGR